jgi:hypothetical protein
MDTARAGAEGGSVCAVGEGVGGRLNGSPPVLPAATREGAWRRPFGTRIPSGLICQKGGGARANDATRWCAPPRRIPCMAAHAGLSTAGCLQQEHRSWSRRGDSNSRPAVYETAALPLSYVGVFRDQFALLPIEPGFGSQDPRVASCGCWDCPMVPRSSRVTVEQRLAPSSQGVQQRVDSPARRSDGG